jgi:hypothetical protein
LSKEGKLYPIILLILGSFLGVMGTMTLDCSQRSREYTNVENAILTELDELRYELALNSFRIQLRQKKMDRDFIIWIELVTRHYKGSRFDLGFKRALVQMLQLNDRKFNNYIDTLQNKTPLRLPNKLVIPTITAHMNEVGSLPPEFQRHLFEVIRCISIINQDVDQYHYYFKRTFDSTLNDKNRKIMAINMNNTYKNMGKTCMSTITSINALDKYRYNWIQRLVIWLAR